MSAEEKLIKWLNKHCPLFSCSAWNCWHGTNCAVGDEINCELVWHGKCPFGTWHLPIKLVKSFDKLSPDRKMKAVSGKFFTKE